MRQKQKEKELIKSIVIGAAALLYLFSPIDIIPDAFLGFGQLDDLGILVLAVWQIVNSVRIYKQLASEAAAKDKQRAEAVEVTAVDIDENKTDGGTSP